MLKKSPVNIKIKSPISQVFHYKQNLFDLHVPLAGYYNILCHDFYKIISCFVFFYASFFKYIEFCYQDYLDKINNEIYIINNRFNNQEIDYNYYHKGIERQGRKRRKLERYSSISFTEDRLKFFIKKLNMLQRNNLFTDEIYNDFKRRLSPSYFIYRYNPIYNIFDDGKVFELNDDQ